MSKLKWKRIEKGWYQTPCIKGEYYRIKNFARSWEVIKIKMQNGTEKITYKNIFSKSFKEAKEKGQKHIDTKVEHEKSSALEKIYEPYTKFECVIMDEVEPITKTMQEAIDELSPQIVEWVNEVPQDEIKCQKKVLAPRPIFGEMVECSCCIKLLTPQRNRKQCKLCSETFCLNCMITDTTCLDCEMFRNH